MDKKTISLVVIFSVLVISPAMRSSSFYMANASSVSFTSPLLPQATVEPTSTPTIAPTPIPGVWYQSNGFPLGGFSITSPVNQTYETDTMFLSVGGSAILPAAVAFSYSLDGKENKTIEVTQPPTMSSAGKFQARTTLQQLSQGTHAIVVFGELTVNEAHYVDLSIFFTVNSPPSTPTSTPTANPNPTQSPQQTSTENSSPSPSTIKPTTPVQSSTPIAFFQPNNYRNSYEFSITF